MDSETHVRFGAKLMEMCDLPMSATAGSLFPQIDRKPAYMHRLFAHTLSNAPRIAKLAVAVDAANAETSTDPVDRYICNRILEERARIDRYVAELALPHSRAATMEGYLLAICSHIYNDSFNNPIQAFLPLSSSPSGIWITWEQIASVDFRWYLYGGPAICDLRAEFFSAEEWRTRLNPKALIAAMVTRLAESAARHVDPTVVRLTAKQLDVEEAYADRAYSQALEFLKWHDSLLARLLLRYSLVAVPQG